MAPRSGSCPDLVLRTCLSKAQCIFLFAEQFWFFWVLFFKVESWTSVLWVMVQKETWPWKAQHNHNSLWVWDVNNWRFHDLLHYLSQIPVSMFAALFAETWFKCKWTIQLANIRSIKTSDEFCQLPLPWRSISKNLEAQQVKIPYSK